MTTRHPRNPLADIATIGSYLLVASAFGLLSREPPHVTPIWAMVVLTTAGVLVLWFRGRRFVWVFAAALAITLASLAYGTGAEFVIVVFLLIQAGVSRGGLFAWGALAATAATSVVGAFILARRFVTGPSFWGVTIPGVQRDFFTDWLNVLVILLVLALMSALVGVNIGHRRRHIGSLIERAEQSERERDQLAEITRAQERERIAREMHDVIAHSLSVMIAMADGANALVETRPEETKRATARVAETGRRTLGEVRRLLGSVREDSGEEPAPHPNVSNLPALIEGFRAAGLVVEFETRGVQADDEALGLHVYRIVQESLTNVLRHGRGTQRVFVETVWSPNSVTILVEDESLEVATSEDSGRGILGIRERAALYSGTVETGVRSGGGWRVFVRLQIGTGGDG